MSDSVPRVITEIINGDNIGLCAVGRTVCASRGQGRGSRQAPWRWINQGGPRPDGSVVKLEAARIGNRWLTSKAALARFMATLTPKTDTSDHTAPTRTASQPRRSHDTALKKLASKLGPVSTPN